MGRPPRNAEGVPSPPISDRRVRVVRCWSKAGTHPLGAPRARVIRAIRWLGLIQPDSRGPGPPPTPTPTFDDEVVAWLMAGDGPAASSPGPERSILADVLVPEVRPVAAEFRHQPEALGVVDDGQVHPPGPEVGFGAAEGPVLAGDDPGDLVE